MFNKHPKVEFLHFHLLFKKHPGGGNPIVFCEDSKSSAFFFSTNHRPRFQAIDHVATPIAGAANTFDFSDVSDDFDESRGLNAATVDLWMQL